MMDGPSVGKEPPPSSKIVIDDEVDGANEYAIAIAAIAATFMNVKQTINAARMPRRDGAWLGTAAVTVAGFDEMRTPRFALSASAMRVQAVRALRMRAMRALRALERLVCFPESRTIPAGASSFTGTAGGMTI